MSLGLVNEQIWWVIARSSGVIGSLLLTASVLWGILLSTDLFPNHRRPAWLLDLHRWLGGLTVSCVVLHIAALMADSYVSFTLADVLLPLHADWKPVPVALGVVAIWLLFAVQLTSIARKRLPKSVWRGVHLFSYVAFWLTALHGSLAGTDAANPMYVGSSVAAIIAVMWATLYRVLNGRRRGGSRQRSRSGTRRPQPVEPAGHPVEVAGTGSQPDGAAQRRLPERDMVGA